MGQAADAAGGQPASARRLARPTLRQVRLASGLVLFAYVLSHLLCHALGNVSLGALEAGLTVKAALWRNPVALFLLYGALAAHLVLGLHSFYGRRLFRLRPGRRRSCCPGLRCRLNRCWLW